MSMFSVLRSSLSEAALLDGGFNNFASKTSWMLGGIRGKKKIASGSTRNKCGFPPGQKLGAKVYDGQRVPVGSVLVKQNHMNVVPGLNTRFSSRCSISSTQHGRVIFSVERTNMNFENNYVQKHFRENMMGRNMFKTTVHVLPDEQHQYFKLVDMN